MMKNSWMFVLAVLFLCSLSHANFVLKLVTDDPTTLTVGDTATLEVWGWVDHVAATGTNGLADWQISVVTDVSGVIRINQVNAPLQPDPVDQLNSDVWDINAGTTGSFAAWAFIMEVPGTPVVSSAGIGTGDGDITNAANYTKLITFQIEAIGIGTAEYSFSKMIGDLVNFDTQFRIENGNAEFYTEGSDNVITVVPEPATMILLGLGSLITMRKRRA